jgi:hypothetical protein
MADCRGGGVKLMDDFRCVYRLPHGDDGNELGQAPGVLHRPSISDAVSVDWYIFRQQRKNWQRGSSRICGNCG